MNDTEIEAVAKATWVADAWGRPNPAREWDELTLYPAVYEGLPETETEKNDHE